METRWRPRFEGEVVLPDLSRKAEKLAAFLGPELSPVEADHKAGGSTQAGAAIAVRLRNSGTQHRPGRCWTNALGRRVHGPSSWVRVFPCFPVRFRCDSTDPTRRLPLSRHTLYDATRPDCTSPKDAHADTAMAPDSTSNLVKGHFGVCGPSWT